MKPAAWGKHPQRRSTYPAPGPQRSDTETADGDMDTKSSTFEDEIDGSNKDNYNDDTTSPVVWHPITSRHILAVLLHVLICAVFTGGMVTAIQYTYDRASAILRARLSGTPFDQSMVPAAESMPRPQRLLYEATCLLLSWYVCIRWVEPWFRRRLLVGTSFIGDGRTMAVLCWAPFVAAGLVLMVILV